MRAAYLAARHTMRYGTILNMHFPALVKYVAIILAMVCSGERARANVTDVQPRSFRPGEKTQLTLTGKDFNDQLRVITSCATAVVKIESVEPEKAIVTLSLPADAPPGPLGLWTATQAGPAEPLVLLVDDLPTASDNGDNHTLLSAQPITTLSAVDGFSSGAKSDFYQFSVTQGQRVGFEVLTQGMGSAMDPIIRLLNSEGDVLRSCDDDEVGPEARFSYRFAATGTYYLEVRDSRHATDGRYHLRVGDFPILTHAYPLAIQRGASASIQFATRDSTSARPTDVSVPAEYRGDAVIVASRQPEGQSSAWAPIAVCDTASTLENELQNKNAPGYPLAVPLSISGKLSVADERDQYFLSGVKDAQVRFRSRTRSLGCLTLLRMALFNPAGTKVAETSVTESDEWSFDYKFSEDGVHRLEVNDLLERGGDGYGYWIEAQPPGSFTIAIKGDAKTPEQFVLEAGSGAFAVDLQVTRFGYEGEIELALADPVAGLRLLNPVIASNATEARIFITAAGDWKANSFASIKLVGRALANPASWSRVTSLDVHRLKSPHVAFPLDWNDGKLVIAGSALTDSYFALEPAAPIQFARPLKTHRATFNLRRINPEFKTALSAIPGSLPSGWRVDVKADNDAYTVDLIRENEHADEPTELEWLVYSEFNTRGRIDSIKAPVLWIDPLQVAIRCPQPLIAGSTVEVTVSVNRTAERQPVTLTWNVLPAGLTAPETVTIPADQDSLSFPLNVAADVETSDLQALVFTAASKFQGNDYSITGRSPPLQVIAAANTLSVHPSNISLVGSQSKRQLVVTGVDDQQRPRDWTHDVAITSADATIAEVRGTVVYPRANGETEITVRLGTVQHSVPVQVANMELTSRTEFESHVLVALSKQGCNTGACHGSPSGKGMFRLSLRAFDRSLDELTLIREDFSRRVNRIDPEQSLLLLKPLMKVSHGGGKQLHVDDPAYEILRDWIREGAAADPPDTPRCVRLEVFPHGKRILQRIGGRQQLAITAHFADGTHRDVTELATFETSNSAVAAVDSQGLVTALARGEAVILVRYLEHIESAPLMFVESRAGFAWASPPPNNDVDEHVNAKLLQMQYLPADTCSDSEFVRRVYLDTIGILPTVDECSQFLSDAQPDKRSRLIDQLLERDEFSKFWALKWGDLLRMTGKLVGDEGVHKYYRWVEDAVRNDMPYDQFAHALVTASGSTLANPPANFYRTAADMNQCVETISQIFLGTRLQCAKCHNHPFERWTQDNYYGLGAFFNRVQRRKTQRTGEMFIWASETGEVTQPRTQEQMKPWLPVKGSLENSLPGDRREVFAQWLVSQENPYFAKIGANRIWSQLFARGIIDPVDDFRDSNPPTNEPLLDALAKQFVESGFSTKCLLRTILNSRTYQASYQTNDFNKDDELYFSHQQPRLLTAEQLLDAVNHVTGISQSFGNFPEGTKATQLPAPDLVKVDFLKVFGQPERSTVCACERGADSNIGMAIELFNGPLIHERLRDPMNRFRRALAAGNSTQDVLVMLYLAAVCRPPSEAELNAAMQHCQTHGDVAAGLEDVCWALLNTDEFLFQH